VIQNIQELVKESVAAFVSVQDRVEQARLASMKKQKVRLYKLIDEAGIRDIVDVSRIGDTEESLDERIYAIHCRVTPNQNYPMVYLSIDFMLPSYFHPEASDTFRFKISSDPAMDFNDRAHLLRKIGECLTIKPLR
jgi:hypothetical protein